MRGFRLGVDDYDQAVQRAPPGGARGGGPASHGPADAQAARGSCGGGLDLDVQSFEVRKDGQPIRLTPLEFRDSAHSGRQQGAGSPL